MSKRKCGFEARESLGDAYWKDERWKEVTRLRDAGEHIVANGLVFKIRSDWGLEQDDKITAKDSYIFN